MSDVRNCKECGRIFQYTGISRICNACQKKDDEKFAKVKEYIYDNPGATISEVSEETGVDEDKILRYLRDGRLEIVGPTSVLLLDCERCGKSISTGRYCDSCSQEIAKGLRGGFSQTDKPKENTKNKMYIAEMKKKR